MFDQASVITDAHSVFGDNETVLVDGKPVLERHRRPGDWIWCQQTEDRLLAVGHAGWLVSVFRDSGHEEIHAGGILAGIAHLAVFVDEPGYEPGKPFGGLPEGARGLLVDGIGECDPGLYEVLP